MSNVISVVGKPKFGKTVSASTFPQPMLVLDFDAGFISALYAKGTDGKLISPDAGKAVVIEFIKDPADADIDFSSYALIKGGATGGAPKHSAGAKDVMSMYNNIIKELSTKGTITWKATYGDKYKEGEELGPFKTLILDPLTTFFRIWKDMILVTNNIPELRRGDYLTLEGVIGSQFIPRMKALSKKIPWIILIDHEDFDATDTGTIISEFPVGPSKNMGKNFSEFLDEVWRMEIQGKEYVWRTKNHGYFKGCGSRHDLPDPIKPATFAELSKYLKEETA